MSDRMRDIEPFLLQAFEDQQAATRALLRRTANPVAVASQLHRAADAEGASVRPQVEASYRRKIACRKGCAWCCHQPVDVAADEVMASGNAVQQRPEDERKAFWGRVEAYAAQVAGVPRGSRHAVVRAAIPCPALGSGNDCSIHAVRPSACRGFDSFDETMCEAAIGDPLMVVPYTSTGQIVLGRLMGHREALTARGYDGNGYDLAGALAELRQMGMPEARRRWNAKERVFSDNALPQINEEETAEIAASITHASESRAGEAK